MIGQISPSDAQRSRHSAARSGNSTGGASDGVEPAADHDHDHVDGGGEQPGNDAGDQQLGDRDLGEHAVEHEQDARRDQRIERAAARDRAGGEPLVVAVLEHFRHRELRHRGGGGDARAGRRAEARAGPVGRDRKPAGQVRRTRRRPRGTARSRCRNCRRSRPSAGTSGSRTAPSSPRTRTACRRATLSATLKLRRYQKPRNATVPIATPIGTRSADQQQNARDAGRARATACSCASPLRSAAAARDVARSRAARDERSSARPRAAAASALGHTGRYFVPASQTSPARGVLQRRSQV